MSLARLTRGRDSLYIWYIDHTISSRVRNRDNFDLLLRSNTKLTKTDTQDSLDVDSCRDKVTISTFQPSRG